MIDKQLNKNKTMIDPIRPLSVKWQNQFNRLKLDTSMIDYDKFQLPNNDKCEVFHNVETYASIYWVENEVEVIIPGQRSRIYTLPNEDKNIWHKYILELVVDYIIPQNQPNHNQNQ